MDLNVLFSDSHELKMTVQYSESGHEIDADFGEIQTVHIGGKMYDGSYDITPKVDSQTMPTKGRVMAEDVTIKSIPFFNVSNNSGGSTVFIAREM